MRAEELRVGNLFMERNSKKVIEVVGIKKEGQKTTVDFSGSFEDGWQADPMFLNDYWFDKFGFHQRGDTYYRGPCRFERSMLNGTDGFVLFIESIPLRRIEFVYQLQNLCSELEIHINKIEI